MSAKLKGESDMQWKEIERVLDEKDRCMKILEEYDRTGIAPFGRTRKDFTLTNISIAKISNASRRTGKKMSQIVDELIRKNLD